MYKSKLYELCQKRAWDLPVYTVTRCGPAHNSVFHASVLVNGIPFNADDISRSSKKAQNKASQVALEHFASALPESLPPSIGAARSNLPFKNQLQEYALKNSFDLPKYTYTCEGSGHALRIKADVTVGGKTYHGTTFSSKLKKAERIAAKAALMHLTADETNNVKDDAVSGMTHLNDLQSKANISMPSYKTRSNGVDGFSSIVDVGNSSFLGDVAKSERQAKGNPKKRKFPMVEEEVRKLNIFDPNKKLKLGEEAEELEENLRKQKILVRELKLQRKNLERETMELLLKGNR